MLLELYSAGFYYLIVEDEVTFDWIKRQKLFAFDCILVVLFCIVYERICIDMGYNIPDVVMLFKN
jgi:hypothetical protein